MERPAPPPPAKPRPPSLAAAAVELLPSLRTPMPLALCSRCSSSSRRRGPAPTLPFLHRPGGVSQAPTPSPPPSVAPVTLTLLPCVAVPVPQLVPPATLCCTAALPVTLLLMPLTVTVVVTTPAVTAVPVGVAVARLVAEVDTVATELRVDV